MSYKTEILRLEPQNDIATQPLDRAIQRKALDSPVEPENDKQTKLCRHTNGRFSNFHRFPLFVG